MGKTGQRFFHAQQVKGVQGQQCGHRHQIQSQPAAQEHRESRGNDDQQQCQFIVHADNFNTNVTIGY
jgi:hypothetical protein